MPVKRIPKPRHDLTPQPEPELLSSGEIFTKGGVATFPEEPDVALAPKPSAEVQYDEIPAAVRVAPKKPAAKRSAATRPVSKPAKAKPKPKPKA